MRIKWQAQFFAQFRYSDTLRTSCPILLVVKTPTQRNNKVREFTAHKSLNGHVEKVLPVDSSVLTCFCEWPSNYLLWNNTVLIININSLGIFPSSTYLYLFIIYTYIFAFPFWHIFSDSEGLLLNLCSRIILVGLQWLYVVLGI